MEDSVSPFSVVLSYSRVGLGGCTVTLVRKSALDKCIDTIRNGYKGSATFYEFKPSDGARAIDLNGPHRA